MTNFDFEVFVMWMTPETGVIHILKSEIHWNAYSRHHANAVIWAISLPFKQNENVL